MSKRKNKNVAVGLRCITPENLVDHELETFFDFLAHETAQGKVYAAAVATLAVGEECGTYWRAHHPKGDGYTLIGKLEELKQRILKEGVENGTYPDNNIQPPTLLFSISREEGIDEHYTVTSYYDTLDRRSAYEFGKLLGFVVDRYLETYDDKSKVEVLRGFRTQLKRPGKDPFWEPNLTGKGNSPA